MKELDITSFKETGMKLAEAIEKAVKDTQTPILTPLPDEIRMTQAQFKDLAKLSGMQHLHQSNDRMWVTSMNVMEVRVAEA